MSKQFRFKEFTLVQEISAQRFGTDSMILGSVAFREGAMNILDIGTGTGALALMMAQKHPDALVDAVEVDPASAEEAAHNFEQSPWAFRLTCYPQSVQEFVADETLHYDLIVSNPPYFSVINTEKGGNREWPEQSRRNARTSEVLTFDALLASVDKVMVQQGLFYVVLPAMEEVRFTEMAAAYGLYLCYRLGIRHDAGSAVQRVVLGFCKQTGHVKEEKELVIFGEDGVWSSDYKLLTNDFHFQGEA